MAIVATIPKLPEGVANAFASCPKQARAHVDGLRALVFETAATTPGVGTLEETLKWGQPTYLTRSPKRGNREISIPTQQPLPGAALQHCIAMALTYHLRKTAL